MDVILQCLASIYVDGSNECMTLWNPQKEQIHSHLSCLCTGIAHRVWVRSECLSHTTKCRDSRS